MVSEVGSSWGTYGFGSQAEIAEELPPKEEGNAQADNRWVAAELVVSQDNLRSEFHRPGQGLRFGLLQLQPPDDVAPRQPYAGLPPPSFSASIPCEFL